MAICNIMPEIVIPEQNTEQDLELKENIAYGPIAIIS